MPPVGLLGFALRDLQEFVRFRVVVICYAFPRPTQSSNMWNICYIEAMFVRVCQSRPSSISHKPPPGTTIVWHKEGRKNKQTNINKTIFKETDQPCVMMSRFRHCALQSRLV